MNRKLVFLSQILAAILALNLGSETFAQINRADPAKQLEAQMRQQNIQDDLLKIPKQVKVAEDQQFRFEPFQGKIPIKSIKLVGDTYLIKFIRLSDSGKGLDRWFEKTLTADELNQLILKLNGELFTKGYVTARIEIDKYDALSRELVLKVRAGTIGKIETGQFRKNIAFPGLEGKRLRLQDLEQGLEQLNRLPSQQAVISLWPGEQVGETLVKVDKVKVSAPYRLSLMLDNLGSEKTGQNVVRANFSFDDLLTLSDQLFISGSKSGLGKNRSTGLVWKEEVPFGYYTFSYSGNYSDSRYELFKEEDWRFFSNSIKNKISLSRNLFRSLANQGSLEIALWHYHPRQKFETIKMRAPKNLSVFETTLQHSYHALKFRLLSELNYSNGNKIFDTTADQKSLWRGAPHAQFNRYRISSDYLWIWSNHFYFSGNVQWQYADRGLPGVVKLSIVDETAGVRGGGGMSIETDQGLLLKQELSFPFKIAARNAAHDLKISPFLSGDLAWGKDKAYGSTIKASSIGGGIKLNIYRWQGKLTLAKMIRPKLSSGGCSVTFELSQQLF